jgi:hypothetical protein
MRTIMSDAQQPETTDTPQAKPATPLAVHTGKVVAVFADDGDPVYHRGRLRYVCRPEDFDNSQAVPTRLEDIDPRAWAL